jgi:TldD protein
VDALCDRAVDAATAAGAGYADVRVVEQRSQSVATRNGNVETVDDSESAGIGVRVLVGGAWGFACCPRLDDGGARDAALRAVAFARASARAGGGSVVLAPLEPAVGEYRTPAERDPLEVPIEEKVALCLRAEEGLRSGAVAVTEASVRALRERRWFRSSEGARTFHEVRECGGGIDATAIRDGLVQVRSFPSAHGGASFQGGWERLERLGLEREALRVAEEANALLSADPCPSAVTTLVVDAEQMQLQLHESVGHPVELDRVYGTEASYAGTSFVTPGDLGSLRYGSPLMNVTADPTTPGGLGSFGWDDEGVPAAPQPIVREGVLTGFLGSRETAAALAGSRPGSMRADGWARMPLVRMTNLHLEPGEGTLEELLADVDEGIYMATNRSWSIDDKRLNFQFGTQAAWEIRKGRLGRMLRDATYTGVTPRFWASLDAVAGRPAWTMYGLTNCGKGQPGQSVHVSHGASPCRFRGVQVGVRA